MTPEEESWVRANAWTDAIRRAHSERDIQRYLCPCMWGPSGRCKAGEHDLCEPIGRTWPETHIIKHNGLGPAFLPIDERPEHPRQSLDGPKQEARAVVWRAEGTCRYACTCEHHAGPKLGQLDLF